MAGRKRNINADEAAALIKALAHPLRITILNELVGPGPMKSPSGIAEGLDVPLPNLSYHMRMLEALGMVERKKERAVRGAVEHFYAATPLARKALDLLETVSPAEEG